MKPGMEKTLAVDATVGNLPRIREFIRTHGGRAGIADGDLFDLTLAADEACANIIEHGYEGLPAGRIELTVSIDADRVRVRIKDRGRPFEPDNTSAPDISADWQDRRIGGLGWHLIQELTDEAVYRGDPVNGNLLVLIKKIEG